eukprot:TRINITY_DN68022_c6_g1_i5.p1 TRINITY_DN68022_c6_g1~~TRINITY_DN68022_c6_g1_i5.p1  ORF type:complete len:170 (+),score=16.35 TRINITY_DN68022_c6_g1_i5:56-565(+)
MQRYGFVVSSGCKLLLGHTTGGHGENRCTVSDPLHSQQCSGRHWTVIKGGADPGETPLQTALREFTEETSVSLSVEEPGDIKAQYTLPNGKVVSLFFYEDEGQLLAEVDKMKCTSMLADGQPEIDAHKFFSLEEAKQVCLWNQEHLFCEPWHQNRKDETMVYPTKDATV